MNIFRGNLSFTPPVSGEEKSIRNVYYIEYEGAGIDCIPIYGDVDKLGFVPNSIVVIVCSNSIPLYAECGVYETVITEKTNDGNESGYTIVNTDSLTKPFWLPWIIDCTDAENVGSGNYFYTLVEETGIHEGHRTAMDIHDINYEEELKSLLM